MTIKKTPTHIPFTNVSKYFQVVMLLLRLLQALRKRYHIVLQRIIVFSHQH